MRLVAPLEADPSAPLARAHPLAKLAAAAVLMLTLFVTVDVVTSAVITAALAVAFPFTGLPARGFARRVAPLVGVAAAVAVVNTLFAADARGAIGGIAVALRLVAISLTGVMTVATIDPTDLADALVQHLRAPPRFVLGALAAWRLAPVFGDEWRVLALARRARGVESERRILDRLRAFPPMTFALLVGAIRRATRLALAMDARGFGRRPCRTLARPRELTREDLALFAGAALVALGATLLSLALGTWRPLFAA